MIRHRLASLITTLALIAALAGMFTLASAPQAQAAGGIKPYVIECVNMTVHTSPQSTAQINTPAMASIYMWVQTERDTHTNKLCGVRSKAQWNAGSSGYSGSVQVSVCWTNVGGSCPGGQPAWYSGTDTLSPYQMKTYYTGWDTSETCGPYGSVAVHTYGTPTYLNYYGMITSCSAF